MNNSKNLTNVEKTNETIEEMMDEDDEEMMDEDDEEMTVEEKSEREYWKKFENVTYEELLTLAKYFCHTVFILQRLFSTGRHGFKVNKQKSYECLRASAEVGNEGADFVLGFHLFYTTKEYDEALFWLQKAALGGRAAAYSYIAQIYDFRAQNEEDIEKNFEYWKLYFQKTKEWVEDREHINEVLYKRYGDMLHDLSDAEICEIVSKYYTKGSPDHSVKPVEKLAKSYELLRKKFLA